MRFYLYEVYSQGGIASVMKKIILILGAIALLGLCTSVYAADVDGKWESESQGRGGQGTSKTIYEFKATGAELTGKITNDRGGTPMETPISEGKIEGDTISFAVEREGRGGGGTFKIMYTGKVAGDKITFTRTFEGFGGMRGGGDRGGGGGAPGGAAAGGPPGGGAGGGFGPPPEIIATRVKE
jgi:hypothetical protein